MDDGFTFKFVFGGEVGRKDLETKHPSGGLAGGELEA